MERCGERISVEEVAHEVGLSASHFRKMFRCYYDCSPRDYLQRCRIYRAKQLMVAGGMNLTQIAYACGFATVHSFSRTFRRVVGIPPSEYRLFGNVGRQAGASDTE